MHVSPYSTCLCRTVRFTVSPWTQPEPPNRQDIHNGWGGWPTAAELGAYFQFEVFCTGLPDSTTGYLADIRQIDRAVRTRAVPILADAMRQPHPPKLSHLARTMAQAVREELNDSVQSILWRLTPYHWLAVSAEKPEDILLCQQFEFAAAHRLHSPSLSDEQNRSVFGKCNNPSGHGHNYRIDVAVSHPVDHSFGLANLESIVDSHIIQRFDHKHLNLDAEEFRDLVPSVENIARICHNLICEPIEQAGGRLEFVRVWETEKTSATYPACRAC